MHLKKYTNKIFFDFYFMQAQQFSAKSIYKQKILVEKGFIHQVTFGVLVDRELLFRVVEHWL